jgi:DNA-binding NtrC family response regulator
MRTLLLLDLADNLCALDQIRALASNGWEITEVRGQADGAARVVSNEEECLVGVALMNEWRSSNGERIREFLMADEFMEWIAVLSSGCLASEPCCEMVTDCFFDFHTLPIDAVRLSVVLGHAYGKARMRKEMRSRKRSAADLEKEKIVSLVAARQRAEIEAIQHCLAINNNNISKAARNLGISRMTMYRLISKLNL